MSAEFTAADAVEIDRFKFELRQRFPGRDVEHLTDEDLLREVMNTVGKPGKLGEDVRCVVSVSMLTEGWDANTVSHVLGVRAFGTQLLCEHVVGRDLRRRSYVVADDGRFEPEYAEVYGVPFSFIPPPGRGLTRSPARFPGRVRAMADRIACEITFPRLVGYRWEIPDEHLEADFVDESRLALDSRPADAAAVVGEVEEHRPRRRRDRSALDRSARRSRRVPSPARRQVTSRCAVTERDPMSVGSWEGVVPGSARSRGCVIAARRVRRNRSSFRSQRCGAREGSLVRLLESRSPSSVIS